MSDDSGELTSLPVPAHWGFTQVALQYEGDDLSQDEVPFAGTLLVQLRIDARPGAEPLKVLEADAANLNAQISDLELIDSGQMKLPGEKDAAFIEWRNEDPRLGKVHQLIIYITRGTRLYTVTGTHREDRFEGIKQDILDYAAALLG